MVFTAVGGAARHELSTLESAGTRERENLGFPVPVSEQSSREGSKDLSCYNCHQRIKTLKEIILRKHQQIEIYAYIF